ncbi:MAG: glycine cleavage system protein GcvH [Treponemataceae bacterium]
MKLDTEARYAKSHEWVRKDGAEYVCGISDHAQHSLGDIVFVDLPKIGASFDAGSSFGVVESVKAASDLYLPIGGKIIATNAALADNPDLVNKDCYGEGWIIRVAPTDANKAGAEWNNLLTSDDYEKIAEED